MHITTWQQVFFLLAKHSLRWMFKNASKVVQCSWLWLQLDMQPTDCGLQPALASVDWQLCEHVLQEIDNMITKASEQGYMAVVNMGSRGLTYATNVIVSTAVKVWHCHCCCVRSGMDKLRPLVAGATYSTLCLKKGSTFKLSVTLANLNRFSKFLHYWKAYKIRYKTNTKLPTSP